MIRNRLSSVALLIGMIVGTAWLAQSQQPQCPTCPSYLANAAYLNGGSFGGFAITGGSGLTLNVGPGTSYCANIKQTYAGGTLTMTNSTTNYVYLDATASCAPASNTSGYTASTIPLATVVTSGGAITSITIDSTAFKANSNNTVALTSTGSPASGNLAKWSGPSSLTNGDISGDCTTSGTLAINCTKTAGVAFAASATTDTTNAANISSGTLPNARIASNVRIRAISLSYGDPGNSSGITASSTATDYVTVPFSCTLSAYNLLVDSGTVTVKFWKVATGTAIPTSGNSISTSGVSISSGTAIHSTTLTDFTTTTFSANDIVAMNVTAATAKFVNAVLECDQ